MAGKPKDTDAAYAEALKRIQACDEQRIDLSGLRLTTLPPEIAQLSALTQLSLSGNQLTTLPPEIAQLSALTQLSLSGNQLTTLPPEIAQLSALTELDLGGNQLTTLPPEIAQLSALTQLDLSRNQLTTLPPEIAQLSALMQLSLVGNQLTTLPPVVTRLSALMYLSLGGNQLTTLPPEIAQLSALTYLYLSFSQLTTLPPEIAQLSALTYLYLSRNQLTTLPAEIAQLSALSQLDLSRNQLTTLPPEIAQLSALTQLELGGNQLTTLPPEIAQLSALTRLDLQRNQLASLPEQLRELTSLRELFLHGNSALQLSPSVLGPDPRQNPTGPHPSAKSILDFYFGRQMGRTRPLNEVKLILVGRGGAGKTSAVRALRDLPFRDGEDSTPGIALCDWTMDGCKGEPVQAHIWDFAGQVITHALHQFFFSVRSVYIVVLTGRENSEREDAEYWLRLIKAFGTDEDGNGPPVIIALNKWDVPGCRPRVDRGALQERYPFIRGFVEMDCKSKRGVSKLKAASCREVDRLKWIRDPFPETWDAVRQALRKGGKQRAHLTYAEFRALCVKHGVVDEGKQDSLAEILHNLGAALNYRNDPRLREATVLQPEWLTKNVYALMRRAEKQAGVLKRTDVEAALVRVKDSAMRDYLVRIMERFEIAYTRVSTGGVWLVPQALPDVQPKGVEDFGVASDATRLRYSYQALPEGLVARAIVRLHEFIEEVNGKKRQWASGAILTREGARALIRTEPQDRQVMITVTGPSKARQQLAGLCQAEMRDIHREIPGLDPIEETQVQSAWVATATLEADEKKGQKTGIQVKDQGTVLVDPEGPNNEYSLKPARSDDFWKPTAFISYSKSNVAQRKRLESELKILKNEGLLASLWHDRMIDPGDTWDDIIQNKLEEADVVIILASVAALATDYITDHEIPTALGLHDAGETVVVPVILEKCRWDKTALGALNALPEKAKPLNNWKPQSDGWNTIADGLAKVFKRLVEKGDNKKQRGNATPSIRSQI